MSDNPVYYISQHNHFDPIWHRCWDRTFDYKGKRYRSYADIEEQTIDAWLDNARRGIGFWQGQAAVFRRYLERNPHRLNEVRRFVQQGLIELNASGEVVLDTNMPSGETLLRNLALGQWYFQETFGVTPTLGSLADAFGHSAQMPQLFRGIGCRMVADITRVHVPGDYWKGLDGSVLFMGVVPSYHVGHLVKRLPCPECSGVGCETCGHTGTTGAAGIDDEKIREAFGADFSEYGDAPFRLIDVGGEEAIPNPRLPELAQEARERLGIDMRAGAIAPVEAYFAEAIERTDDPDLEVSDQVESNAIFTGCYVTRIRIKQELRRLENLVNTAERWATIAYLLGVEYPDEELLSAWRNTVFLGFHDSVTGTHKDQPYFELLEMAAETEGTAMAILYNSFDQIESSISVLGKARLIIYNSDSWERNDPVTITLCGARGVPRLIDPAGQEIQVLDVYEIGIGVDVTFRPSVPPLGYTIIEVVADAKPVHSGDTTPGPGMIENEFYSITVSDHGIRSIIDKRLGVEILDIGKYLANELILEEDIGDPWGPTQEPSFEERLIPYTTGVKIRRAENISEITITGQYKGTDDGVKILTWRQSVVLYMGFDRIDFRTDIDWDADERRIRVVFPTNIKTDEAVYSIPYGALKRSSYEPDFTRGRQTNGDWPAVNWIDVYGQAQNRGVALINTGTPAHKVEDGVIFMSLLRSPSDAWTLDRPDHYICPDYDGSRDAGPHEFFYSLISHPGDHRTARIEKHGREVNNPLICRRFDGSGKGQPRPTHSFMNMDATENVIVTALKKAERDESVIVRLVETAGVSGEAQVRIEGAGEKPALVDFLERDPRQITGKVHMGPWKIATVKLDGAK